MTRRTILFSAVAHRFSRHDCQLIKQMMSFLLFGTAAFFIGSTFGSSNMQSILICLVAVAASIFLIYRT
jgi:hypothetical protein